MNKKSSARASIMGIALFIAIALLLSSCPLGGAGSGGSIMLTIESTLEEEQQGAMAKSVAPIPLKIETWVISGDGPEEESFSQTVTDDSTTTLRQDGLAAGTWTITATGKNADGTAIVSGSATILVEKGAITYAGISCGGVEGTGTLSIQMSWPPTLIREPTVKAYVSYVDLLSPSRELDLPLAITGAAAAGTLAGIPSGPIVLEIELGDNFGDGKLVWSDLEVVHIVADETIAGTWTLVANEIDSIGQGDVDISVVADIPQPLDVTLTLVSTASSDAGNIFTVTGTSSPESSDYVLYCDGNPYAQGYMLPAEWKVGPGLSPGPHFISLVCRDGINYGSATLKVTQLAAGIGKGTVLAWGYAPFLGKYEGDDSPVPVQVAGLTRGVPTLVDAGAYHAMAVTADGELWTWGINEGSQCGHSFNQTTVWTPGRPLPGVPVAAIAAGTWHSLAFTEDYGLAAWGSNSFGQLGTGDTTQRKEATLVRGAVEGQTLTNLSIGDFHSLALGSDGTAYSWGRNASGELGDGSLDNRLTSVKVKVPAGVTFTQILAAKDDVSFGLSSAGAVYGWGSNDGRRIADSTTAQFLIPTKIPLSETRSFIDIATIGNYGYAVASDGTVWRWGGLSGWLTQIPSPKGTTISEIDGMEETILGRGADGKLYTMGENSFNALGDGIDGNHRTDAWTLVQGLSGKNIGPIAMGFFGGLAVISW